jgi:hypothetical protein
MGIKRNSLKGPIYDLLGYLFMIHLLVTEGFEYPGVRSQKEK